MRLLKRVRAIYNGLVPESLSLPEPKPVKAPSGSGPKTVPTYLGSAKKSLIGNNLQNTTNLSLSANVRNEGTINQVIKKLVLSSPDLSHAVETKIKSALSSKFTAVAYDETGRIDDAGTELVNSFLLRLNCSSADQTKFPNATDIRSIAASCLYDRERYGAMCLELVLGQARLPAYPKVIPVRLLEWAEGKSFAYPVYKGSTKDIHLNYPTIFYSASAQDGETPYSSSPLQAAIQACLWDGDFVDSLRRAAMKNLLQRLKITINSEKWLAAQPITVKTDAVKLKAEMDATIDDLEGRMADLDPEDVLVFFDTLSADTIADANRSEDRSITVLHDIINGKISAGAKTLPSVLGRGESSNAASTESMLFLKSVAATQLEFNILFSRTLTLVNRLCGMRNYVIFEMEEVNLRPSLELESFRAIKQSRLFEQLSYGFISDGEFSIATTGNLPPKGHVPLSGTRFYKETVLPEGSNEYSNTSVSPDGKPDSTQSQKTSEAEKKGVKSK